MRARPRACVCVGRGPDIAVFYFVKKTGRVHVLKGAAEEWIVGPFLFVYNTWAGGFVG